MANNTNKLLEKLVDLMTQNLAESRKINDRAEKESATAKAAKESPSSGGFSSEFKSAAGTLAGSVPGGGAAARGIGGLLGKGSMASKLMGGGAGIAAQVMSSAIEYSKAGYGGAASAVAGSSGMDPIEVVRAKAGFQSKLSQQEFSENTWINPMNWKGLITGQTGFDQAKRRFRIAQVQAPREMTAQNAMGRLSGAVRAFSSATGAPIGQDLANELMRDALQMEAPATASMAQLKKAQAEYNRQTWSGENTMAELMRK